MEKAKKGFFFRSEWVELLQDVSDDVRLSLYDAIVAYVLRGEILEFDNDPARVAFRVIRTVIDRDEKRASHISAVRSEAGKRGMEVRYGKKSVIVNQ